VLTLAILSWRGRHPTGISVLPSRLGLVLAAAGFVIFAAAPQWWFPDGGNRELRWAVWEQLIGSSYVIYAVIVLFTGGIAGGAEVRGVRPKVVRCSPGRPAPASQPRSTVHDRTVVSGLGGDEMVAVGSAESEHAAGGN
jgi:hypothetical protein